MPEQLLTVLNLCLLALLYLFFARVLRAVWTEVREPAPAVPAGLSRRASRRQAASQAVPAPPSVQRPAPPQSHAPQSPNPPPPSSVTNRPNFLTQIGGGGPEIVWNLMSPMTIGRSPTCNVEVDDSFISGTHARIRDSDGQWWLEDLGSTNGTSLNGTPMSGPMPLSVNDRISIGSTEWKLS